MRKISVLLIISFLLCGVFYNISGAFDIARLSEPDIVMVDRVLNKLGPFIKQREADATTPTITFDDLYSSLDGEERDFLDAFRGMDLKDLGIKIPYLGEFEPPPDMVVLKGQIIKTKDGEKELPPQFVPKDVYERYALMNAMMKKDIGKGLYVESGYRSPAYQLYLLLYYLKYSHDYSLKETLRFVAWPGYSEHGAPSCQALDFINEFGVNGEENAQEFEDLEEFKWLVKNAGRYGFVLSYPKDSDMTYEPWHWRFEEIL